MHRVPEFVWRGDKVEPRGLFRTEGITTKQMNGGDPAYVMRTGLLNAIHAHVSGENGAEKRFRETSSFLSFSASEEVARGYAAGRSKRRPVSCPECEEDAVVFRMSIGPRSPLPEPGLFDLHYGCDYRLAKPISMAPGEEDTAKCVSCEYCSTGKRAHRLVLVDVVSYLSSHAGDMKRVDSLEAARRDSEWLVYPVDFVPRLGGISPGFRFRASGRLSTTSSSP